jgi:hypothetical protein
MPTRIFPFYGVLSWQLSLAPDLARERQCQAQDYD